MPISKEELERMTVAEAEEIETYGSVVCTVDRLCEILGIEKKELGARFKASKQTINNYRMSGKEVEYNPAKGEVDIYAPRKLVNSAKV